VRRSDEKLPGRLELSVLVEYKVAAWAVRLKQYGTIPGADRCEQTGHRNKASTGGVNVLVASIHGAGVDDHLLNIRRCREGVFTENPPGLPQIGQLQADHTSFPVVEKHSDCFTSGVGGGGLLSGSGASLLNSRPGCARQMTRLRKEADDDDA
jgi:hypothetical protein